jgi:hypothetical protein
MVVSQNGGWMLTHSAISPAAILAIRFDKMAEALGCYGEYVRQPPTQVVGRY